MPLTCIRIPSLFKKCDLISIFNIKSFRNAFYFYFCLRLVFMMRHVTEPLTFMKRIIVFFLAGCLYAAKIIPGVPFPRISSFSVANTSVSDVKVWSSFQNPALLALISSPEISALYHNRYIITALSDKCFSVAVPTSAVNAAFSVNHYGYSVYHEIMAGLAFARDFGKKFGIGIQFNYFASYFREQDRYYGVLFPQIGFYVPLSRNFLFAAHVFNPFLSDIRKSEGVRLLPSVFSLGGAWHLSPDFLWRFQGDKELGGDYRMATGFQYDVKKCLSFHAGIYGSGYLIPCIGLGFRLNPFSFFWSGELHPLLGMNTVAGLKFRFGRK